MRVPRYVEHNQKGLIDPSPHDVIRLAPGLVLFSVDWIRRAFGYTPSGMTAFLDVLGVPVLDGTPYSGGESRQFVLALSLELALLAAYGPRGPSTTAWRPTNGSTPWEEAILDPTKGPSILGLLALAYGASDRAELQKRIETAAVDLLDPYRRDAKIKWTKMVPRPVHVPGGKVGRPRKNPVGDSGGNGPTK